MKKKQKQKLDQDVFLKFEEKHLTKSTVSETMYSAMEGYSAEVIKNRAIIDARDGLKPVARRILFMYNKNHVNSKSKHVKVNKMTGLVLGEVHPHGNMSIDAATVVLARNWEKPLPLIDIHGNRGNVNGSEAAGSRYIEGRLTPIGDMMTKELKKKSVEFIPNYDDTSEEPKYLPSPLPIGIINNSSGIAVGMASNILPHNPLEIIKATKAILSGKEEEIYKIVKGPDFPTAGIFIKNSNVVDEIDTGRAKYLIRGVCKLIVNKDESYIDITEIPYGITTDKLLESIASVLEKHPMGATVIEDNSRGMEIDIRIEFKKGTSLQRLKQAEALLYKYSKLQQNVTVNNLMIVDGSPKTLGIKSYLKYFIRIRKEVLARGFQFDLDKATRRNEIVDGLLRLVDEIDTIIPIAKTSDTKDDLIKSLQDDLEFTELQATEIAAIPIYRLGKQDTNKLHKEKDVLKSEIDHLTDLLETDATMVKYIVDELTSIEDVLKDHMRLTQPIDEETIEEQTVEEIKTEDLIEEKEAIVVVKSDGSMQRMTKRVFNNGYEEYPDKHTIVTILPTTTTSYVIAVTRKGLALTRLVNDLPEANLKTTVLALYKEIPDFKSDDEILDAFTFNAKDDPEEHLMLMVSKFGLGKVVSAAKLMPNVKTKRYLSLAPKAHGLKIKGDELIFAKPITRKELQVPDASIDFTFIKENGKERVLPMLLKKVAKRNDTGTSSGTKVLNTRDGAWTFKGIQEESE